MRKLAFIYPGQGAQKAGMGADFYENSPAAGEVSLVWCSELLIRVQFTVKNLSGNDVCFFVLCFCLDVICGVC